MTSKARMLVAIKGGIPDCVPVTPDISNMIPCRLTGRPFWDIYLHGRPTLFEAYLEAVKYFGFDGWFMYSGLDFKTNSRVAWDHEILSQTNDRIVRQNICHTPDGDLVSESTYYRADSPTVSKKPVEDIEADFAKVRHLFPVPTGYDAARFHDDNKLIGDLGINCLTVGLPGFACWIELFRGSVEAMTYAHYDHPDLMDELRDLHHRQIVKQTEMILDEKPDVFFVGASGSITLQSPELFRHYSLPTMKAVTRMAKEAGVPSMMHSCGKAYDLCKMAVEETDLDCLNPLEMPPMGDCELGQVKKEFGSRLCLMGNLHTTQLMLLGKPEDVEAAVLQALEDAKAGGGFILSTGDQCGRDTPDENIFTMVRVAREYGRYDA